MDTDCGFGYRCLTGVSPKVCEYANECVRDTDCPSFQTCQVSGNWKVCQFGGTEFCSSDDDCAQGEFCDVIFAGYGQCKSMNECESDAECPTNMECTYNEQLGYNECVEVNPCEEDEDCGFGFRCVDGEDGNSLCEYANECSTGSDCAEWEICEAEGNWNVCSLNTQPSFCTSDDQCDTGYYCDKVFNLFGTCKSLSECSVDEDCPQGTVCQSNGTYNECVDPTPQSCWFDFQCPDGWSCDDGVCAPAQSDKRLPGPGRHLDGVEFLL